MPSRRPTLAAPPPDPFGERRGVAFRERLQLLGARFDFETASAQLLRIVRLAYARLPPHKLAGTSPCLRVKLVLTSSPRRRRGRRPPSEPPQVRPLAGDGILAGAMGHASFVALAAAQRSALVVVSREWLRYSYHVRYELLEFAVYVLAARVQALVPLHAGCIAIRGQGVLVLGPSGSGKSTLVLQCLLDGLEILAEDSVLVQPETLRATGVASFLHVRRDSLRFLARAERAAVLRNSTLIRRRSGVEKLEIDLRHPGCRLAAAPPAIRAVVFLSAAQAGARPLLKPMPKGAALRRLAASQRYAANQPGWRVFRERLSALPAYEVRRGAHPREAVASLRRVLEQEG
jgi:energy-coupling factor transporter ATP-binding protein EcfA2